MSMPLALEDELKKREGIFEAISGSSRPKPRLYKISSGSSSYRSRSSDTLQEKQQLLKTHTFIYMQTDSLPNHWFSCCCFTSPEVLHVLMTIVHHSCKVPRHGVAAFSRACGVHTSTLLLELAPFGLGCDFIAEERRQWPACDQPKTERDGNILEDLLTHWPLFVCCCSGGDWL